MRYKTRNLALASMFTGFAVVLLYLSAIIPLWQMILVAAASLFTAAAVIECGAGYAAFVYSACCALAAILIPMKSSFLMYLLFFGYYPIIKSIAEKTGKIILEWTIKLVVFAVALSIMRFLLSPLIFGFDVESINLVLFYVCAEAFFILYDVAYSNVVTLYIVRISKKRK